MAAVGEEGVAGEHTFKENAAGLYLGYACHACRFFLCVDTKVCACGVHTSGD